MKKWFHNAIQIKLPTYELLQYVLAAQKANCILGHIKIRMGNMSREMIPPYFIPPLKDLSWSTAFSSAAPAQEQVQRRAMKAYQRAGTPLLLRQSEKIGVIQPGEGKAARRPYSDLPVSKGHCRKAVEVLFVRGCSDRTWGNGLS